MPSQVLPATDEIVSPITTPQSITLSNGNVLIYESPGNFAGAGTVARLLSPDGSALDDAFQLDANYGGELYATALSGGGFALAYRVDNGLYAMGLFNNDGAVQSDPIAVNPNEFGVIVTGLDLTALSNGNFVATWSGSGIDAQIFDPAGATIGGPIAVGEGGLETAVVAQADGAFTVIWRNTAAGYPTGITGQKVTSAGVLDGPAFAISTQPGLTKSHPVSGMLANGDIAVAWLIEDPSPDGGWAVNLRARIIHTDGSVSDVLEVTRTELTTDLTRVRGNINTTPEIIALSGGGFVVGWANIDLDHGASNPDSYFAAFDSNGLRLSENVQMSPGTPGYQYYPALAAAGDDEFFAIWGDGSQNTGAQLFTVTEVAGSSQTGTANADNLTSSDGNDSLTGFGGADTLDGLGGADRMAGGADDDTYHVDHRYDLVIEAAGQGNDTVIASASYYLTLDSSVETMRTIDPNATTAIDLRGNALTQTIIGNAGANLLDGGGNTVAGSFGDFLGLTPNTPDTLIGGAGDDTYVVYRSGDVVTELAGGGDDTVRSWISYTLAADLENLSLVGLENLTATGNSGDNILRGNGGRNTLYGLDGNDVLDGGEYNDVMVGGLGDDIYYVDFYSDVVTELAGEGTDTIRTSFSYTLAEGAAIEILTTIDSSATNFIHLTGNSDANTLIGNATANTLSGVDGNDVIDGGGGTDTLIGGLGDDWFHVDNAGDNVIEGAAEGAADRVLASVSYTLGAGVYAELLTTSSDAATTAINLTGNELANSIRGNAGANSLFGAQGNDLLDGGLGADQMYGGADDDTYLVDNTGDHANENAGEGIDLVQASIGFELGANVENLALTGSGNINGAGNGLANVLTGNAGNNWLIGAGGNDVLDGGLGADRMDGGADNDTYVVDNTGDRVNESVNAGTDLVQAAIGFTLGANVENLTLTGSANINGAGNTLANALSGNSGVNWLVGQQGNDVLDGGLGADKMDGGADNDTYYVDNAGDRANENANEGIDLVQASVGFELGANVEDLTLTGSGNTNGAGNALANVLTGNSGNNWLVGLAGNDVLEGGLGADRMNGGAGDDTYHVDNASDRVTENASEGADQVFASVGLELGANVENLLLTGNGNINGAGNSLANMLTGNAGNNWLVSAGGNDVLDGGLGADKMDGGTGDDTYYVDNAGDRANEKVNEGTDHVFASVSFELGANGANVENLTLTGSGNINGGGNALANLLTGNTGNNWLVGLQGNDALDGGLGADKLDGGAGQDTFAFTTALGGGNVDVIIGFVAADDTIQLDDSVFDGLAAGALATGAFNTGIAATQADDRIIYNSNTGALLFDVDGLGGVAAVQFATLSAGLSLTSADFLVI